VYVQCRFNNEILTTDPVSLGPGNPTWDTELAWELNAKALHYLRTQRTPIKLLVCGLSPQGGRKSILGHLILDLRAAEAFPAKEVWIPLLPPPSTSSNSLTGSDATGWLFATGSRPEIKISFGSGPKGSDRIDNTPAVLPNVNLNSLGHPLDQTSIPSNAMPSALSPIKSAYQLLQRDSLHDKIDVGHSLQPVLQQDRTYLIGSNAEKLFRLCLSLVQVHDLHYLSVLPSALESRKGSTGGYYLFSRILGNEFRTQSFSDPKKPYFPEESISIDLVSSTSNLMEFFGHVKSLSLYLCYDEQVLGKADLDLSQLLIDCVAKSKEPADEDEEEQNDKKHIKEEDVQNLDILEDSALGFDIKQHPTLSIRANIYELPTANQTTERARKPEAQHEDRSIGTRTPEPLPLGIPIPVPPSLTLLKEEQHPVPTPADGNELKHGIPLLQDPGKLTWHQYRFSIDIKSVKDLQSNLKSVNMYFKYAYEPFGTRAPFISHPPVQVVRGNSESVLTTAFCAYEFVMAPKRLQVFLNAVPLEIVAIHKDAFARDTPLGVAVVNLASVLEHPDKSTVTSAGQKLTARVHDHWVNICAQLPGPNGNLVKMAAVRIVLCLEDFGCIEEQAGTDSNNVFANSITVPPPFSIASSKPSVPVSPNLEPLSSIADGPGVKDHGKDLGFSFPGSREHGQHLWEAAQYQVDEWKRIQMEKLEHTLNQRQEEAMKELELRLNERATEFDQKMSEYREVEMQLDRLLSEMEKREDALSREEQNVYDRRIELEKEFESKCDKVEEAIKKLEFDTIQQQELHQHRIEELERQKSSLDNERREWEEKYRKVDQSLFDFKNNSTVLEDREHLKDYERKVEDLQNKLQQAEKKASFYKKQRTHFKDQWLKSLADYAQFKKEVEAERQNRAQVPNASHPPLDVNPPIPNTVATAPVAPSTDVTMTEKLLEKIRNDLEEVKVAQESLKQSLRVESKAELNDKFDSIKSHEDLNPPARMPTREKSADQLAQLERLMQERDLLLKSGVYNNDDFLIKEMSNRINQLTMN
jgi:hypothetical protein